jgi:hypothetical protein
MESKNKRAQIMNKMKLKPQGMRLFHWHLLLLFFLLLVFVILLINTLHPLPWEILIALLTSTLGGFYFFHQQNLEKVRFFKDLVTEFNRRYDEKNNGLFEALRTKEAFNSKQEYIFIDYFNLCAEEYLFYDAGYIDKRVWNTWYNGMKQFGQDQRIIELWKEEIQTDSYYGFEFPINDKS